MYEKKNNPIITEIQNEYKKIDERWLMLHYRTFVLLVLFGFLIECIIGASWFTTGHVEISLSTYIFKYVALPLLINLSFVLCGLLVIRSSRMQQINKTYFISILYVGVCFVFYTAHIIFNSLYLIFTIPMLLTIVYSNYTLTTFTAIISIISKTISDLFVVWDPDKVNPLDSKFGLTNLFISAFIVCIFYVVCVVVIRFEKEKNAASIQKEIEYHQTQQKLMIDELTEVYNRKALRQSFQDMEEEAYDNTFVFVMIDIDNFKTLNDDYGHDTGDECLKEFANILIKNCTEDAMPFRFGGDEFCILFKNMPLENVVIICESIGRELKNSIISGASMPMTASFGIACYDNQMNAPQLLKHTDSALYRAKTMKDAICVYNGAEDEL